jgi:hypothetical protein
LEFNTKSPVIFPARFFWSVFFLTRFFLTRILPDQVFEQADRNNSNRPPLNQHLYRSAEGRPSLRKLIAFDDDTRDKLTRLGRDRMATLQELADEAFADLLKKHGIPVDLKDALRKSVALPAPNKAKSSGARKAKWKPKS